MSPRETSLPVTSALERANGIRNAQVIRLTVFAEIGNRGFLC